MYMHIKLTSYIRNVMYKSVGTLFTYHISPQVVSIRSILHRGLRGSLQAWFSRAGHLSDLYFRTMLQRGLVLLHCGFGKVFFSFFFFFFRAHT